MLLCTKYSTRYHGFIDDTIHELNVNLFIYVHTNNLCRHLTIDKVKTLNPLNLNIAPIKCVAYREIFT